MRVQSPCAIILGPLSGVSRCRRKAARSGAIELGIGRGDHARVRRQDGRHASRRGKRRSDRDSARQHAGGREPGARHSPCDRSGTLALGFRRRALRRPTWWRGLRPTKPEVRLCAPNPGLQLFHRKARARPKERTHARRRHPRGTPRRRGRVNRSRMASNSSTREQRACRQEPKTSGAGA